MNDWTLNLRATGQEKVAQDLQKITRQLNEQDAIARKSQQRADQITKLRKASAELAKQERKESFDRLSAEEKLLRLQQQRERIQERLARAEGNAYRTSALRLRLAQTDSSIRQLGSGGSGATGGGGFMATIGGMRSLLGLGAVYSLINIFRNQLDSGNRTRDLADQYDVEDVDLLRLKAARLRKGVSENTALSGLNAIQMARAQAVQDPSVKAAFGKYGISSEMVQDSNLSPINIGIAIRKSLGRDGADDSSDPKYLKMLMGRRWREQLAIMEELADMPKQTVAQAQKDLQTLDNTQKRADQLKENSEGMWRHITASVIRAFSLSPDQKKAYEQMSADMGYSMAWGGTTADQGPGDDTTIPVKRRAGRGTLPSFKGGAGTNTGASPTADALARVGLFVGVRETKPLLMEYRRQLDAIHNELKSMRRDLNTPGPPL